MNTIVAIVSIVAGQAAPATQPAAATAPDVIEQRLDAPIGELTLQDTTLAEVISKLSQASGVEIRLHPRAVACLPWGRETKLQSLAIRAASLRASLTQVLEPLCLEFAVEDGGVVVRPSEPLDRMDVRATWKELELLARLRRTPYTPEAFSKLEIQYRITSKLDAPALLADQLARVGRGTIAEMLETAACSLGWAWFPQGDHVVVLSREAVTAHAMSRRVTEQYFDKHLGEVLFDLGRAADVHVHLEPGTFKMLPSYMVQRYPLSLRGASIRQAFDYIAADTGLAYRIKADGVHVGPAKDIDKMLPPLEDTSDSPFVAKISVPIAPSGLTLDFLYRESELPAEVTTLRRRLRQNAVRELRKIAASQPATQAEDAAGS